MFYCIEPHKRLIKRLRTKLRLMSFDSRLHSCRSRTASEHRKWSNWTSVWPSTWSNMEHSLRLVVLEPTTSHDVRFAMFVFETCVCIQWEMVWLICAHVVFGVDLWDWFIGLMCLVGILDVVYVVHWCWIYILLLGVWDWWWTVCFVLMVMFEFEIEMVIFKFYIIIDINIDFSLYVWYILILMCCDIYWYLCAVWNSNDRCNIYKKSSRFQTIADDFRRLIDRKSTMVSDDFLSHVDVLIVGKAAEIAVETAVGGRRKNVVVSVGKKRKLCSLYRRHFRRLLTARSRR